MASAANSFEASAAYHNFAPKKGASGNSFIMAVTGGITIPIAGTFGGTLGGPLATDRLFFFGGFQGTTVRETPPSFRERIPTAAMLAGDFTAFASPGSATTRCWSPMC